jgi:hypothetical protein
MGMPDPLGLFKGLTNPEVVNTPAEWDAARKQLLDIGSKSPTFGVKGTAGMSNTELQAQDLLAGYAANPSQEVQSALASLKEAGNYTNLMDVPEFAALYNTGRADNNSDLNRLGRTLQLKGNTNTSSGAGVMTNRIGENNARLMGTMAPYAAQNEAQRLQAPITAAQLASSDTQSRLGAVAQYGALPRQLKQLSLDSQYMADYLNETAPYDYQARVLGTIGGIGNTVVTGGGLSDSGMVLQAAASAMGGSGGIAAMSDIRVKENITPIENAVKKVSTLTGYTFNYKENPKEIRDGGVMAQELEKVLPDAVVEVNGIKMVKYQAVIGLLVSAVKELAEKMESKSCQA